jgi:hypothetical protein
MNYGVYLNKLLIVIGCNNANEIEVSLKLNQAPNVLRGFQIGGFINPKTMGFITSTLETLSNLQKIQKLELKVLSKS